MIDLPTLLLFLAASWALILIPGPDILYVFARSLGYGRRVGIIAALGIGFGECVQTMLAVLGLATILATSMTAFLIIKYLGAAYLVYLGIKTLRDKNATALPGAFTSKSPVRTFSQGVLTNLFNPKAELFFVAFLPQKVMQYLRWVTGSILLGLGIRLAVTERL